MTSVLIIRGDEGRDTQRKDRVKTKKVTVCKPRKRAWKSECCCPSSLFPAPKL